ncbi:MAG: RNA polymerase subunit sigma-70 [Lachnospiraceae bacterium]|nr:RNA polymerase subunit sigma-70 [Lachnospiraceae bacterium]
MKESKETVQYLDMYLKELEQIAVCEREEQERLLKQMVAGDLDARNRLVEGNLRRAAEIAAGYVKAGVSAAELVAEANLALTLAVEQYANDHLPVPALFAEEEAVSGGSVDHPSFVRFTEQYIRASLDDYVEDEHKSEDAGSQIATMMNVMDTVTKKLAEEYGREATLEEVAQVMKMEAEDVKVLMKMALDAVSSAVPQEETDEVYLDEEENLYSGGEEF